MLLFTDIESLKEYAFHALIYAANQYIIGTRPDIQPTDLFWSFMREPSINPRPNHINDGYGCIIDVRNEKPSYFTIIRSINSPILRVVFERNVSPTNGPTTVDFIARFDEASKDYTFEVVFVAAPTETEYALHEECQMMFGAFLGMLKMMGEESYAKMNPEDNKEEES